MSTAFDAKMSGLEVATPLDSPISDALAKEEDKYPYHLPDGLQVSYDQESSYPHLWRTCRLRPTTLILSVALALVTVLAIVAAAVGGSLAAKNANVYRTLIQKLKNGSESDQPSRDPTAAHPSTSSMAQNYNNSCPIGSTTTYSPTDACTKLPSTYISSLSNKTLFHVSCNTSYHDHNILGVFVYSLEDCIEACASFNHFQSSNTTCLGLTFDLRRPQQGGKGNCFLKDFRGMDPTAMNGVSSAEML